MNMKIACNSLALVAFIPVLLYMLVQLTKKIKILRHPPSPPWIPIVGHLHLLKSPLHHVLRDLASRHGPVFSLWLGRRPAVVVSAPWAVEQCLVQNDVVFANRPSLLTGHHLGYRSSIITWSPYGAHWRNLRRVAAMTTLCQKQIQLMGPARRVEVCCLIQGLLRSSGQPVNLTEMFDKLARNLLMRAMNGKPWEIMDMTTPPNMISACDFLPFLRWVGYKGVEKQMIKLKKERDVVFQGLIDEYRERRVKGVHGDNQKKPMLEYLLEMQEVEPDYYTDDILKGLLLTMLLAGSDTTARTLEWAVSLLLTHPHILEKAKNDIATHVEEGKIVEESDVSNLTYISCIINETLRLYPPTPLLVPHYSSQDCQVGPYDIGKGTLLIINVWAIHRDPRNWEDPDEFRPERFKDGLDEEAYNYKYLPFGIGRRACPGGKFALRFVTLVLATFIQCFDWEAVEVNLNYIQAGAIVMPKEKPLFVRCVPRPSMATVIARLLAIGSGNVSLQ